MSDKLSEREYPERDESDELPAAAMVAMLTSEADLDALVMTPSGVSPGRRKIVGQGLQLVLQLDNIEFGAQRDRCCARSNR